MSNLYPVLWKINSSVIKTFKRKVCPFPSSCSLLKEKYLFMIWLFYGSNSIMNKIHVVLFSDKLKLWLDLLLKEEKGDLGRRLVSSIMVCSF